MRTIVITGFPCTCGSAAFPLTAALSEIIPYEDLPAFLSHQKTSGPRPRADLIVLSDKGLQPDEAEASLMALAGLAKRKQSRLLFITRSKMHYFCFKEIFKNSPYGRLEVIPEPVVTPSLIDSLSACCLRSLSSVGNASRDGAAPKPDPPECHPDELVRPQDGPVSPPALSELFHTGGSCFTSSDLQGFLQDRPFQTLQHLTAFYRAPQWVIPQLCQLSRIYIPYHMGRPSELEARNLIRLLSLSVPRSQLEKKIWTLGFHEGGQKVQLLTMKEFQAKY